MAAGRAKGPPMSGDHNQNQTDSGWRKRQIALEKMAENARELGLNYQPQPCPTCEALARTVMLDQTSHDKWFAKAEALKLALEALEICEKDGYIPVRLTRDSITALRQALANEALDRMAENARELGLDYTITQTGIGIGKRAEEAYEAAKERGWVGVSDHRLMEQPAQEPEFFTHCVDKPYDWSEWVCPDPKGYLMKCCDCGLVHEAEFGVVRYKSETEREDCDIVDDPNLQAVFRMRRSEQWSPEDTAHRAGGMPMEQPAQDAFKAAYIEAMIASNEAGFAGMTAAETIRELSRGRSEAFKEIAEKVKEMPWESDTKDSFLVWLQEQR